MDNYLHPADAHIERKDNGFGKQVAVLRDEEGVRIMEFPAVLTDEQIMLALSFANHLYAKGIEAGKARKAAEIKACLQIV